MRNSRHRYRNKPSRCYMDELGGIELHCHGPLGAIPAIVGVAMSAYAAYAQGQTQKDIYNYDAQVATQQARAAQVSGEEKSRQLSEQKRKMVGAQTAAFGGAGVDPGQGTPLEVMANTYSSYERDIQTTGYNTDTAVKQDISQADIYRYAAGRAGMAGDIGAGTAILGGVSNSLLQGGAGSSLLRMS